MEEEEEEQGFWLNQDSSPRSSRAYGSVVKENVKVGGRGNDGEGEEHEEEGEKKMKMMSTICGRNFGEEMKDGEKPADDATTEERLEAVRREIADLSERVLAIRDDQVAHPSSQGDDPSPPAEHHGRDHDDPRRLERLRNLNDMEQRLVALSRATQGHLAADVVDALEGGVAIVREFVNNFSLVVDEDKEYTRLERVQHSIAKLSIKVEAIKRSEEELDSDPRRAERLDNIAAIEQRLWALEEASAVIEVGSFFPLRVVAVWTVLIQIVLTISLFLSLSLPLSLSLSHSLSFSHTPPLPLSSSLFLAVCAPFSKKPASHNTHLPLPARRRRCRQDGDGRRDCQTVHRHIRRLGSRRQRNTQAGKGDILRKGPRTCNSPFNEL